MLAEGPPQGLARLQVDCKRPSWTTLARLSFLLRPRRTGGHVSTSTMQARPGGTGVVDSESRAYGDRSSWPFRCTPSPLGWPRVSRCMWTVEKGSSQGGLHNLTTLPVDCPCLPCCRATIQVKPILRGGRGVASRRRVSTLVRPGALWREASCEPWRVENDRGVPRFPRLWPSPTESEAVDARADEKKEEQKVCNANYTILYCTLGQVARVHLLAGWASTPVPLPPSPPPPVAKYFRTASTPVRAGLRARYLHLALPRSALGTARGTERYSVAADAGLSLARLVSGSASSCWP